MKLEIGKASVALNQKRQVLFAEIQASPGIVMPLKVVDMEAMLLAHEAQPEVKGVPFLCAVNPKDDRLWVHPRPDAEYPLYLSFGMEAA